MNNQAPAYLYSLLSPPNKHYNTRNYSKISSAEQKLLVILFCHRKLENGINLIPQYVKLLHIQYFVRPTANSTFGTNDVSGLKLLTRLRVGLSHLREHKFKNNFQETLNPLCPYSLEVRSTYHSFMRCEIFLISEMSFLMTLIQLNQIF